VLTPPFPCALTVSSIAMIQALLCMLPLTNGPQPAWPSLIPTDWSTDQRDYVSVFSAPRLTMPRSQLAYEAWVGVV
jgi:hypothetical protein